MNVSKRYTDAAALGHHMEQAHVQDMLKWTSTGILAGEPEVFMLDKVQGFDFVRPEVKTHSDPLLLVTDIDYKPGTAESTIPYWKAVFETTRDEEQGALLWQLATDPNNPDRLLVVHAYESRDYLMSVHATGKALKECQAHGKDIQTGIKPYFLKVVGGYLTK
jgi:quinol monooxygenase YgiN